MPKDSMPSRQNCLNGYVGTSDAPGSPLLKRPWHQLLLGRTVDHFPAGLEDRATTGATAGHLAADLAPLEHNDRFTRLAEFQCLGQADDAGADDGHIGRVAPGGRGSPELLESS